MRFDKCNQCRVCLHYFDYSRHNLDFTGNVSEQWIACALIIIEAADLIILYLEKIAEHEKHHELELHRSVGASTAMDAKTTLFFPNALLLQQDELMTISELYCNGT